MKTMFNYCKLLGHLQEVCLKMKKNSKSATKNKMKSDTNILEESNASEVVLLDEVCKLDVTAKPVSS